MILVELCAGSAACAIRWARAGANPPLYYQGSKRGYADQILGHLGLKPGGMGSADTCLLVESGPWAHAWGVWRSPEGRRRCIEMWRGWADCDPRELFELQARLSVPLPPESPRFVATWAMLQFWAYASKAVWVGQKLPEGRLCWKTPGTHPQPQPPSGHRNMLQAAITIGGTDRITL